MKKTLHARVELKVGQQRLALLCPLCRVQRVEQTGHFRVVTAASTSMRVRGDPVIGQDADRQPLQTAAGGGVARGFWSRGASY